MQNPVKSRGECEYFQSFQGDVDSAASDCTHMKLKHLKGAEAPTGHSALLKKDHSLTSCACVYFAGGTAQRDSRVHKDQRQKV